MPPFTVSPAAPHELLPACRLLFADGRAEHCRDRLLGDADTSGLFVVRDADGLLRAAALVQALPGGLGVMLPPRGDSSEARAAATAAGCVWLRQRDVKVCQAFIAANVAEDVLSLERGGFRHTTQLILLRRDYPFGRLSSSGPLVEFEQFSLSAAAFPDSPRKALLATHEGTLDCPELQAARTPGEIIASFEAGANTRFYFASRGGDGVGVVLFDFDPAARSAELSYLGVVPMARGRGVGRAILAFAMAELAEAGCRTLTLSVDARNAPAIALYTRHGFIEYNRREVWLASWSP